MRHLRPDETLINVLQGDFAISQDPKAVLGTVLGSCIAVCLTDSQHQIGGMNHFLLPNRPGAEGANIRYGAYSMELLINGLLKAGARKDRLTAKIFGGASMMSGLNDIGAANAVFADRFLAAEGIPCQSRSVGGKLARRIRFWPTTGAVRQFLVPDHPDSIPVPVRPAPAPTMGEVTMF